ncbi:MAG TPA: SGNH/GDSL hydrolase family protein [Aggregatilineales bacterium]|nr:SGNH/GDSL hydrolase family protein [Anaerolineales bacterium]HRE49260.1 SGNH/GDSL hydrolase family protein [Aggregatilineales bacterium]
MRTRPLLIISLSLCLIALSTLALGITPPMRTHAATTFTPPPPFPLPEPEEGTFDETAVKAIDLRSLPILPNFLDYKQWLSIIARKGVENGLNANAFTKLGDCMTASESFLRPIASGTYDLATYTSLESVIAYYKGVPIREGNPLDSFANPSFGAESGFNAASVLDSTWSDPTACGAEESPLACELRQTKPAIAVILFGTNDLKSLTPAQFDYYFRRVVVETVNSGVVPILSTFPNQPGLLEQSEFFNQIVAKVAAEYQLPLINLWLAFDTLPNQGIDPANPTHMTAPESGKVMSFAEADLNAGHNVHNLLTLQALEGVLTTLDLLPVKQ